jgi:hypothetical protein
MKKNRSMAKDEWRAGYRRSDFGAMVRGKYAARLRDASNGVMIDPKLAPLFPNQEAVNAALSSLAEVAQRSARIAEGGRQAKASRRAS